MPRKSARSTEEIIQGIDAKIVYHQQCIDKLQKKKDSILHPARVLTSKEIATMVKKSGLSIEEIAERLGVEAPNE